MSTQIPVELEVEREGLREERAMFVRDVQVAAARELGAKVFACPSTGNLANAVAAAALLPSGGGTMTSHHGAASLPPLRPTERRALTRCAMPMLPAKPLLAKTTSRRRWTKSLR